MGNASCTCGSCAEACAYGHSADAVGLEDDLENRVDEPVLVSPSSKRSHDGSTGRPSSSSSTSDGESWRNRLRRPRSARASRGMEEFKSENGRDGVLGCSSIGTVVRTRHRESCVVHALRQISKKRLVSDAWKDEVATLRDIDHPHICKVSDTWEDTMSLYMIMELCKGGNLTDLSESPHKFNESSIAILMEQMVSAVSHLHEHRMVHSDLRPENWLFGEPVSPKSSARDLNLKMIDFGLANKHGKKGRRSANEASVKPVVRTPSKPQHGASALSGAAGGEEAGVLRLFCRAPEQTQVSSAGVSLLSPTSESEADDRGSAQDRADCWALGIIAFFMLSGQAPFPLASGPPENDHSFQHARFVFMPTNIWRPVSSEAKNFIALCLQRNPATRPSAEQMLSLPWMQLARAAAKFEASASPGNQQLDADALKAGTASAGSQALQRTAEALKASKFSVEDPPLPTAQAILGSFERIRRLQLIERAAIMATAFGVPADELQGLWKAFEDKDVAKSGVLTLGELLLTLMVAGASCQDLAKLAQDAGLDVSCHIAYADFVDQVRDFQVNIQDNAMWEVFSRFSKDADGRVPKKRLLEAFREDEYQANFAAKFPQLSLERVLRDLDGFSQVALDFSEFRDRFRRDGGAAS